MTSLMLMLGTLAVVAAIALVLVAVLGRTAREATKAQRDADRGSTQAGSAASKL